MRQRSGAELRIAWCLESMGDCLEHEASELKINERKSERTGAEGMKGIYQKHSTSRIEDRTDAVYG